MQTQNTFRQPSKWRAEINKRYTIPKLPMGDDVRKIRAYIKHRVSDKEIIKTFNITESVLNKIREGTYDPLISCRGIYEQQIQDID